MSRHYPPGPPQGLLGMETLRRMQRDLLGFSVELARDYGDAVHWRLGPAHFFQFTHPETIGAVLVRHARQLLKPRRFKKIFARWDGQGLVTSEGDLWIRQRRLIQPAFAPRRVQAHTDEIVRLAARRLAGWPDRAQLEMTHELTALTLDIVVAALFGSDAAPDAARIGEATSRLQQKAMRELSRLLPLPEWLAPGPKAERDALTYLDQLIWSLIARRRAQGTGGGDLLSLLLAAVDSEGDGQGMDDRQARDEIMTLFLAGHETTATSLIWTLYLLARHPEQQAALAEQVCSMLGDRPPAADDLPELAPVERAVKEAMRLYPAVYFTSREAVAPVEIGGYLLPRGAQVHVLPFVVHRDPRWWDEPLRYCPDRFLPEREEQIPAGAYLPFGLGPRACIGRGFALLEMTLIVTSIIQRFEIIWPAGAAEPQLEAQISLHPRGGLPLEIRRR